MNNLFSIIVTYNAMKWVDKCLGCWRISKVSVRLVVIDNGSTDGTVDYIKEHYPEVHVILNETNRGFGQANNQGIEYAYKQGATHFFLQNQDVWLEPDAMEKMVAVQNKYDFAIVSPIHLSGSGNTFDYGFYETAIEKIHNIDFVSDIFKGNVKEYYEACQINAAAWLISRRAIEKLGGFDPLFFHYGEDMNYCQRMQYHGEKMVFVPKAVVYHDRKQYGNVKVYKKGVVRMSLLLLHSDINDSFFSFRESKVKTHLIYSWLFVKRFCALKWKDAFRLFGDMFCIYTHFFAIMKSRKHNKNVNKFNWLDITSYD